MAELQHTLVTKEGLEKLQKEYQEKFQMTWLG